jgi:hypothetical protein
MHEEAVQAIWSCLRYPVTFVYRFILATTSLHAHCRIPPSDPIRSTQLSDVAVLPVVTATSDSVATSIDRECFPHYSSPLTTTHTLALLGGVGHCCAWHV